MIPPEAMRALPAWPSAIWALSSVHVGATPSQLSHDVRFEVEALANVPPHTQIFPWKTVAAADARFSFRFGAEVHVLDPSSSYCWTVLSTTQFCCHPPTM